LISGKSYKSGLLPYLRAAMLLNQDSGQVWPATGC